MCACQKRQDQFRRADVGLDRVQGTFHDQTHAHRRGQVKNDIRLIHQFGKDATIHDAVKYTVLSAIAFLARQVANGPSAQVVQDEDFIAARKDGELARATSSV